MLGSRTRLAALVAVLAAALGAATAAPADASGSGYAVIDTIAAGSGPFDVAIDPTARYA